MGDSLGQTSTLEMVCTPNNQGTTLSHLQINNVGGENPISDSQGMIFNLYVHFVKIYILLNYKRRYVRLTCIFFHNFILDNYNKNDYTLISIMPPLLIEHLDIVT